MFAECVEWVCERGEAILAKSDIDIGRVAAKPEKKSTLNLFFAVDRR